MSHLGSHFPRAFIAVFLLAGTLYLHVCCRQVVYCLGKMICKLFLGPRVDAEGEREQQEVEFWDAERTTFLDLLEANTDLHDFALEMSKPKSNYCHRSCCVFCCPSILLSGIMHKKEREFDNVCGVILQQSTEGHGHVWSVPQVSGVTHERGGNYNMALLFCAPWICRYMLCVCVFFLQFHIPSCFVTLYSLAAAQSICCVCVALFAVFPCLGGVWG